MGGAWRPRQLAHIAHKPLAWHLWTVLVVCAIAANFYLPALLRTGGVWPAPLDDVYIYFGFARSFALNDPFSSFVGNGYSSGSTSIIYPLLLAPGYALGLHGSALGIAAAIIALLSLVDLCRSLRDILGPYAHFASWWIAPFVVAIPLLNWSWFSGMETALFGAVLGRALRATHRAISASPHRRRQAQWRCGLWLAILPLARPESLALALPLAIAATYHAGSLRTLPSLTRSLTPLFFTLGAQSLTHRILTGESSPAGAVRKLLWSDPYREPQSSVLEATRNLLVLGHQAFVRALGEPPFVLAIALLAITGAFHPRTRKLGIPLSLGCIGSLLLVAQNSTARYQNYRYAAPSLAMMVCVLALGLFALSRRPSLVVTALGLSALFAPLSQFTRQVDHFTRASGNIVDQHGEVARKLAAMKPRPRRVLIGDAGVIPYLSNIPPIDGLGLGGYRRMPFARASVHGLPCIVELIERLPPLERPDVMALYPNWWQGIADRFGQAIDAVQIHDNVICASDTKVIYRARWSDLAHDEAMTPEPVDQLDVADLIDERAHDYRFPHPGGGWVVSATRLLNGTDIKRYDAGRIIPNQRSESFRLSKDITPGPARLRLRSDQTAGTLQISQWRAGNSVERQLVRIPAANTKHWNEFDIELSSVQAADTIRITPVDCDWRHFNSWLFKD